MPRPGGDWEAERADLHARLRALYEAIEEVLRDITWGEYDVCDCGHRYCEHKRVTVPAGVHDVCTVDSCPCVEFDTSRRQFHDAVMERQAENSRMLERAAVRRIRGEDGATENGRAAA